MAECRQLSGRSHSQAQRKVGKQAIIALPKVEPGELFDPLQSVVEPASMQRQRRRLAR